METKSLATTKKRVWSKIWLLGFIFTFLLVGTTTYCVWRQAKILLGAEITYTDGSIFDTIALIKRYKEYANIMDVNRCEIAWNQYVGKSAKERHQVELEKKRNDFTGTIPFYRDLDIGAAEKMVEEKRQNLAALDPFTSSGFKEGCEQNIAYADRVSNLVVGKTRADISLLADLKEDGSRVERRHNMTWLKEADGKWYRDW